VESVLDSEKVLVILSGKEEEKRRFAAVSLKRCLQNVGCMGHSFAGKGEAESKASLGGLLFLV
jgi:hypothetical protein